MNISVGRRMRFDIFKRDAWLWELKAANGSLLARSHALGYKTKAAAIRACDNLILNACGASIFVNGKELDK